VIKKQHTLAALAGIAVVLAVAGCAPTNYGGSTDRSVNETKKIPSGPITLNVLDSNNGGASGTWQKEVNAEFMKKYPNITVKRATGTFSDLQQTVRLRLSSNTPPDVVVANQGWGAMATLAKDKLILPLNTYSKIYGWDTRYPKSVNQQQMVSKDFKSLGNGNVYGVPSATTSVVGVYYDRSLLSQLGVGVPKNLADFQNDLALAKARNIIPIQFGDQDQLPAALPFYMVTNALGKQKEITNFTYGIDKTSLASTGWTDAASTVQKWVKNGYFTPSFTGINSGDATTAFLGGKGLFLITWSGGLGETPKQDKNLGFFVLNTPSGTPLTNGSCNSPYSISSRTKNPNAAAAYLDFVSSPRAAQIGLKLGLMPQLLLTPAPTTTNPLFQDELTINDNLLKNNGYLPYYDWSSLTFLTTIERQGQNALALQINPGQLTDSLQADVSAFLTKK
jgi:raffinose/stachyose/melibiose transport system substrate-binding protein